MKNKKNFAALRQLFSLKRSTISLSDITALKTFVEYNLEELNSEDTVTNLNGDIALQDWVVYLESLLEQVNEELERRCVLNERSDKTLEKKN